MFRVDVQDYKDYFGKTESGHEYFANFLDIKSNELLTDFKGSEILFYNLNGEFHAHKIGRKSRLIIFNNGSTEGSGLSFLSDVDVEIDGVVIAKIGTPMLPMHGSGEVIVSTNGIPIAEYFKEYNTLNVLFDAAISFSKDSELIWTYLLRSLNNIFEEEANEFSWIKSNNRDKLIKELKENTKTMSTRMINDLKRKQADYEYNVNKIKEDLKATLDNLHFTMKQLTEVSDDSDKVVNKMINDLDLIAKHDKIKDIRLEEGRIIIITNELIIIDDLDRRFIGGEFTMYIDLQNSDVGFDSNNRRPGFWSDNDVHPHVSDRGNACFGNISSTIVELCSQNEVYALVLLLIDFLESANTSDPAGSKVINWQAIDEYGNHIELDLELDFDWHCDRCGGGFYDGDEGTTVYRDIDDDGELYGEHYVCDDCLDDYYYYEDFVEEYIEG